MATSQDFCNWVCDKGTLYEDFLMYAFMASQSYLRELGSGAVHKTIYMPAIESFHIYAPNSVDEQATIAHTLGSRLKAAEDLQAKIKLQLVDAERLPERFLASAFESE